MIDCRCALIFSRSARSVRALRGLTDPQIESFVGALADVAHVVVGAYAVDLVAATPTTIR